MPRPGRARHGASWTTAPHPTGSTELLCWDFDPLHHMGQLHSPVLWLHGKGHQAFKWQAPVFVYETFGRGWVVLMINSQAIEANCSLNRCSQWCSTDCGMLAALSLRLQGSAICHQHNIHVPPLPRRLEHCNYTASDQVGQLFKKSIRGSPSVNTYVYAPLCPMHKHHQQ